MFSSGDVFRGGLRPFAQKARKNHESMLVSHTGLHRDKGVILFHQTSLLVVSRFVLALLPLLWVFVFDASIDAISEILLNRKLLDPILHPCAAEQYNIVVFEIFSANRATLLQSELFPC